MRIEDIVNREKPRPWAEGDNIPWHEPGFSSRMLAEHLSQEHDLASRREPVIEEHVRWIHAELLGGRPAKVLDLCCGPGLYTARLARLGHECTGIDYSPAAVAYAEQMCAEEGWTCRYRLADVREAEYGSGHDLAMMIYGELNVFRPSDAGAVLSKVYGSLNEGGTLLLEPHGFEAVRGMGEEPTKWSSHDGDVFTDRPSLRLCEGRWDADTQTTTVRYYVIEAGSGNIERYAQTFQAYDEEGYRSLVEGAGFTDVEFHRSLGGAADETALLLLVLTARKGE